MPKHRGMTMCRKRSWVLSEWAETRKAMMAAKKKGGAQRMSDVVLLYPSVLVSCGKNWLKLRPIVMLVRASAMSQTVEEERGGQPSTIAGDADDAWASSRGRPADRPTEIRRRKRTLVVGERELHCGPVADLGRVVLDADVLGHALDGELLLGLGEAPARRGWEVGKHEVGDECDEHGDGALDVEQPPARVIGGSARPAIGSSAVCASPASPGPVFRPRRIPSVTHLQALIPPAPSMLARMPACKVHPKSARCSRSAVRASLTGGAEAGRTAMRGPKAFEIREPH